MAVTWPWGLMNVAWLVPLEWVPQLVMGLDVMRSFEAMQCYPQIQAMFHSHHSLPSSSSSVQPSDNSSLKIMERMQ